MDTLARENSLSVWDTRNLGPIGKRLRLARAFRTVKRELDAASKAIDEYDVPDIQLCRTFNWYYRQFRDMPEHLVCKDFGLRTTLRLREIGKQFA
jgi:hypothetical protein